MKFFEYYTQEGQTQLHRLRMLRQVLAMTLFFAGCLTVISFIGGCFYYAMGESLWLLAAYGKAWVRMQCFEGVPEAWGRTSYLYQKGHLRVILDAVLLHSPEWYGCVKNAYEALKALMGISMKVGVIAFVALTGYWFFWGMYQQRQRIMKGQKIVSKQQLRRAVKKYGASTIHLAGVPLPQGAECEHIMITGTTGSGKTNALQGVMQQVKALGHKAIIVDTTGNLVTRFFNPAHDKLLNPLDQRSSVWHLWSDCQEAYEFSEWAESMIPLASHQDRFWTNAARQLLATTAHKLKNIPEPTLKTLLDILLTEPLDRVASFFEDTRVGAFVDPAADKMTLSIRATLAEALVSLDYVEKEGCPFSIKQWIANTEESGWLFLACTPEQRELLRPLLSAWLSLSVKSLMQQGEDLNRRVWFMVDELASLNQLPILARGLSEIRRFGGCFVLAFQDLNQLDLLYGGTVARTLSSLMNTKVVFRLDSYAAKQMAPLFGEHEIHDRNRSISFGAHEVRDGISLTDRQLTKPLITSMDLMQQPKLTAYVKFLGDFPIAKVEFPLQHYPKQGPDCVPQPKR